MEQNLLSSAARLASFFCLSLGTFTACTPAPGVVAVCRRDRDCEPYGDEGRCEEDKGFCTFADEDCEAGRRWHVGAGEGLAGQCVEPGSEYADNGDEPNESTGSELPDGTTGTSDPTNLTSVDVSTDTMMGNDTLPPMTDSTGMPSPDTGSDTSDSTGSAGTDCASIYGAVAGFELCVEAEGSCEFSAILNNESCEALCTGLGQTCSGARLNPAGGGCVADPGDAQCGDTAMDQICICSR